VKFAKAQQEFAVVQYQQTIQTAFREVSDALVEYRKVKEIRTQQELLVTTLQDRSRLAYLRYQGGVDTLLNALDADRDLFNAELSLTLTRRNELLSLVQCTRLWVAAGNNDVRKEMSKSLNDYVTLGRSGLRVSPLCLGTMTFGNEWGWGSEEDTARAGFRSLHRCGRQFHRYSGPLHRRATVKSWSVSSSENAGLRDRVVLATSSLSTPSRVVRTLVVTDARISTARSKPRYDDCRLTTSICTGCTPGTQ